MSLNFLFGTKANLVSLKPLSIKGFIKISLTQTINLSDV